MVKIIQMLYKNLVVSVRSRVPQQGNEDSSQNTARWSAYHLCVKA